MAISVQDVGTKVLAADPEGQIADELTLGFSPILGRYTWIKTNNLRADAILYGDNAVEVYAQPALPGPDLTRICVVAQVNGSFLKGRLNEFGYARLEGPDVISPSTPVKMTFSRLMA